MKIKGNWAIFGNREKHGKYNEQRLLGIVNQSGYNHITGEYQSNRKRGLMVKCPNCQEWNYIPFASAIYSKQGEKILSGISYTTCTKCGLSYDLNAKKDFYGEESKIKVTGKTCILRSKGIDKRFTV